MKRELIDICQPIQIVTEERRKLEAAGYILIDQHGGGDLYSSLVYADYANATEDERKEIMRMHNNHLARCRIAEAERERILSVS